MNKPPPSPIPTPDEQFGQILRELSRLGSKVDACTRACRDVADEQARSTKGLADVKCDIEDLKNEIGILSSRVNKHGRRLRTVEETVRVQVDDDDLTGRYDIKDVRRELDRRDAEELHWWRREWVKWTAGGIGFLIAQFVTYLLARMGVKR